MSLRKRKILCYLCLYCCITSALSETDTLQQGHRLKDGEYLVSAGKVFTLGFFNPQEDRSIGYFNPETAQNSYIGIWYTYDVAKRPVWIANRNKPFTQTSGALEIDSSGDFKITDHGLTRILLESNKGGFRREAVLHDTGNLMLRELKSDGSSSGGKILWQSFDYPTDILLLGMKIGFNYKKGQSWSLSSWVSDKFPAPGTFTLGLDPNGTNTTNQLIMWRRGEIYWKSGIWNKGKFPNLKDYYYKFNYVSNEEEKYFTLSAYNTWWYTNFPMYKLNANGAILNSDKIMSDQSERLRSDAKRSTLTNIVVCKERHYHPGPGCVKKKLMGCRKNNWFDRTRGNALSEGFKIYSGNHILGLADCEEKCMNNCSCAVYTTIYPNKTGCELWYSNSQLQENGYLYSNQVYREFYIQRSTYELDRKEERIWLWLIVATGLFMLLLLLAWLGYYMRQTLLQLAQFCYLLSCFLSRRLREYFRKLFVRLQSSEAAGANQTEEKMTLTELGTTTYGHSNNRFQRKRKLTFSKKNHGIQVFSFESMVQATNQFSPSNKLGQGGYGIVYKGILGDNQEIAIKRLSTTSKQGRLEFMNEVKLVAKLQHANLVKLIGCCIEQGEKILIYEYMQNKSLDYFLFDSRRKLLLYWKQRFTIIEGVAHGLLYLHKYSRLKIIHRDLKAGNILLDREMNPKISDFGLAKLFEQNETRANTQRVVGTHGYMPPEYALEGYFSEKSDVFSFGILLLEIISSMKSHESYCKDRPLNLSGYAWELFSENRGSEFIDQTLVLGKQEKEQAMKCINIGLLCVQENATDRPTMSTVVALIANEANRLPKPNKPAFFMGKGLSNAYRPQYDVEQGSLNDVTITEMVAR